ncbi:MAG: hypothetical protein U9Q29_00490 [Campylobacterota bacterium]|nr:hypothetical protein [Campylobacterota bacterium]
MEIYKIIENFGGTTLAILIFAIIFIFKFHNEISDKIKAIKKVSKVTPL